MQRLSASLGMFLQTQFRKIFLTMIGVRIAYLNIQSLTSPITKRLACLLAYPVRARRPMQREKKFSKRNDSIQHHTMPCR